MKKKEKFRDAKSKLHLMQKLHKFHEDVMKIIPGFVRVGEHSDINREYSVHDMETSLEIFAEKYCELLKKDLFESRDLLDMYDFDGAEKIIKHVKDLYMFSIGYYDVTDYRYRLWNVDLVSCDKNERPTANTKISLKQTPKEIFDRFKEGLDRRLWPIEKFLTKEPIPKVNILQKIFGRKKYFKMKKTFTR